MDQEGDYSITMSAPDAAILHVHHALVIDGDTPGQDGGEFSASIKLQPGLHPFKLRYLSKGKNATFEVNGPSKTALVR